LNVLDYFFLCIINYLFKYILLLFSSHNANARSSPSRSIYHILYDILYNIRAAERALKRPSSKKTYLPIKLKLSIIRVIYIVYRSLYYIDSWVIVVRLVFETKKKKTFEVNRRHSSLLYRYYIKFCAVRTLIRFP